jgi:single-strand DNA-binding protein
MIGRNTKDIELKQLTSGSSVIEFSIAVKRSFKNANGEYDSDFFNCVAFSKTAETISRFVKKGDMLGIEGRLQTRSYTNKEGRKINVTEIIVENVEFLQTKKQEEEQTPAEPKWEEIKDPFAEGLPF